MVFERPDIVRPPSEWRSYFLPLTSGCSNNTCAFCGSYGSRLQVRDVEDAIGEIDALATYINTGVYVPGIPPIVYTIASRWDGERVFLQDGDALVYPFPKLRQVLQHIDNRLPSVNRIATYATAQDILRRSSEELGELKQRKLGVLYMGLETGDDELLKKVNKGVDSRQMVEAALKVKQAGIDISVTAILGLGGIQGSERHVLETARILSEIDPDYVGALTLTLVPGTPLYRDWQAGVFTPISPFQSLKELRGIIENSSFSHCFFSSMHASNYLSVRGVLPQDKQSMSSGLDKVLTSQDDSLLRPEFLRGL